MPMGIFIAISLVAKGGAKKFLSLFIRAVDVTVRSQLITIFGRGTNFPNGAAPDPTFLLGSNASNPAKVAVNAQGRALLSATIAEAMRAVAVIRPDMYRALSFCEPCLNNSSFAGNLAVTTASGGTSAAVAVTGRVGVVQLATSTSATANARANLGFGAADNCIDPTGNVFLLVVVAAPDVSLFSGGATGRLTIGFIDTDGTGLPTDAAFFRSDDGGAWQCQTRRNSVASTVTTSILPVVGEWRTFAIRLTATLAEFWIDGVLQASIDTNLPGGAGRETGVMIGSIKTSAHATNGALLIDSVRLSIPEPVSPA